MIRSRTWHRLAVVAALAVGLAAPLPALAQPPVPTYGGIVGTVTSASGQPAPDVRVTVYDTDMMFRGWATTDATGSYAVSGLDSSRSYKVEYITADYRRQWAHGQASFQAAQAFPVTADQDTVVDEVLLPTGTLVITAVDAVSGAPVAEFSAEVFNGSSGRSGQTTTGTVTLADLTVGDYHVTVRPGLGHFEARSTATVAADATTAVRLELEPAAVLETTLVDAATGAPVPGACIRPVQELDVLGLYVHNCADQNGRVRAGRLTTGSYRIFVKAIDGVHGSQWVGTNGGTGSRYLARTVQAQAGTTVTVPPIRLDLAGTIAGAVTDAASGAPVSAVCAYPYATSIDSGPEPGPHCSDGQGRYTLSGLGPYHWPVEFVGDYSNNAYAWQWSGGRPNQLVAQPVRVQVGQTSTLDARMRPAATISGRAQLADGTPLQGTVHPVNALTGDPAAPYATTDENGHYELTGLAGQFVRLYFWAHYLDGQRYWYRDASGFHSATPVWVPSGATTSGIDFVVPNG